MPDDSPLWSTLRAGQAEGATPETIEQRAWERHGTTCAMLALDSSGMTRASRTKGIVHFLVRYMQMRELVDGIIVGRGCLASRSFADNLFAEFPDADTAVSAAREIHRALRDSGLELIDGEPYRVCLAVGYGRVLANGPFGVMGDEMNIVAKLAEEIAGPGETLLTRAAHDSLSALRELPMEEAHVILAHVDVTFHRLHG